MKNESDLIEDPGDNLRKLEFKKKYAPDFDFKNDHEIVEYA